MSLNYVNLSVPDIDVHTSKSPKLPLYKAHLEKLQLLQQEILSTCENALVEGTTISLTSHGILVKKSDGGN